MRQTETHQALHSDWKAVFRRCYSLSGTMQLLPAVSPTAAGAALQGERAKKV